VALNRLVSAYGYAASTFATAEEYLLSDLVHNTDCLISDVQLPGMSGPDLQARLIADGYRIPTVFITGLFSKTMQARVLKAGAVEYLAKPCNAKCLVACIEKATERIAPSKPRRHPPRGKPATARPSDSA